MQRGSYTMFRALLWLLFNTWQQSQRGLSICKLSLDLLSKACLFPQIYWVVVEIHALKRQMWSSPLRDGKCKFSSLFFLHGVCNTKPENPLFQLPLWFDMRIDLWFPLRKSSSSDSQGSQGPDGASCPFVLSLQFVLMIAGCQPVHRIRMLSLSIMCNSRRWIVFYANTCVNCEVCALSLKAPTLTMEGGRLKRSLQLVPGRDFEIVPEPVWRALYHWYGANLSLPRPVSVKRTPTQQFNECDCKCDVSSSIITVYLTGAMLTFSIFATNPSEVMNIGQCLLC